MKYFDKTACLFVIYFFPTPWVYAQTDRNLALKLRENVVHLQASFEEQPMQSGFGFVIGEKNDVLYITTARHVVIDDNSVGNNKPKELKVKFYHLDETFQGDVLRYDHEKDVAIISVKKPDGYEWKKNCIDKHPKEGGTTYYIGKVDEWTIPTNAAVGGIKKINDLENTITAENLNIASGSSGGPLLSKKGIIGVITNHDYGGDALAVGLKAIENIATKDGQYSYVYSLRQSKLPAKTYIISGLGLVGVTGVILGVQKINDAKTSESYSYYKTHKNPESTVDYPPGMPTREDLYDEANNKYKEGQALVIGGFIALGGAAAWLFIKQRIIKPRDKSLSKLSITPQVYWTNGSSSMDAKGFQFVYNF
jgi:hypothetical protein